MNEKGGGYSTFTAFYIKQELTNDYSYLHVRGNIQHLKNR